jgi:hypothetical protein
LEEILPPSSGGKLASSTLKREAVRSLETTMDIHGTTRCDVPEVSTLHGCENLKSNRISTWLHYMLAISDPFIILKLE